jgi:ubiquinone/menaquinone biosynthesis C-methylase UbiE
MSTSEHEWESKEYARAWVSKDQQRALEREAQFTAALNWLSVFLDGAVRVMDLGSGPGTLAGKLLAAFPEMQVVCLDGSEEMLAQARERLAGCGQRASFIQADFGAEDWSSGVPRDLDAVVSARAVHNLRKPKPIERVYRDLYELLRPGGLFMNIERVNFSTPKLRRHYRQLQIKTRGKAAKMDGPAPNLLQQFRLLKRAGFKDIDCFWREGNTAIVAGFKRAPASDKPKAQG